MSELWTEGLLFLPDDMNTPALEDGIGMVCAESAQELWSESAQGMLAEQLEYPWALAAQSRCKDRLDTGDVAEWRGRLAFALLCDTWETNVSLTIRSYSGETSALARAVLKTGNRDTLQLVMLNDGQREEALGLLDPELVLIPAAVNRHLSEMMPSRCDWYLREEQRFSDPVEYLNYRDRVRLLGRLRALKAYQPVSTLIQDLEDRNAHLVEQALGESIGGAWETRVKAISVLSSTPGFEELTSRTESYAAAQPSQILRSLGYLDTSPVMEEQRIWYWRGKPFARSNEMIGAEPVVGSSQEQIVSFLAEEISLLEQHSERFLNSEADALERWLLSRNDRFHSDARQRVRDWQHQARINASQMTSVPDISCPIDIKSPATISIINEILGESLAQVAMQPFSDLLLLMPEAELSDDQWTSSCTVSMGERRYITVPPFSDPMAEYLAKYSQPAKSYQVQGCAFETKASGGIEATITLFGKRALNVKKMYPPASIRYEDQSFQVALWPAVPIERQRWNAYYLSVTNSDISYLNEGKWIRDSAVNASTKVVQTDTFPWCVSLWREGICAGALVCNTEICHPGDAGQAVIGIDPGETGVTVAMALNNTVDPVMIPSVWKPLLRTGNVELGDEPLPVWPMGPILSGGVIMWHQDLDEPLPLIDGMICPEETSDEKQPLFNLINREDQQGKNACRILLLQTMLLCSFHAVMHGANSVEWRLALPTCMSVGKRQQFMRMAQSCAIRIESITGLPRALGGGIDEVRSAYAAGVYVRHAGYGASQFCMLDIGASNTSMAVYVMGMERPAIELSAKAGLLTLLHSALKARPACAVEDYGAAAEEMKELLISAASHQTDDEQSFYMLDRLLGSHAFETQTQLLSINAAGRLSWTQALLMLGLGARFTLVGMMLERVAIDNMLTSLLPGDMVLMMLGRGSRLLSMLDEGSGYALINFSRFCMNQRNPVHSIRIALSDAPKLEIARGLCDHNATLVNSEPIHASIDEIADPEILTLSFLREFALVMPNAAQMLFPGWFLQGGYLTMEAEQTVRSAAAKTEASAEQRFLDALETLVQISLSQIIQ